MRSCAYEKYGWTDRVITSSYTSPHPAKKNVFGGGKMISQYYKQDK